MNTAAGRTWTPPAWDPDAVAADYLRELRQQAESGPLDGEWLDGLASQLVAALRSAYTPQGVEQAIVNLEPMLAAWEQYALQKHFAARAIEPQAPVGRTADRIVTGTHQVASSLLGAAVSGARAVASGLKGAANMPAGQEVRPAAATRPQPWNGHLALPLDGRALNKSVVPTWLVLVALCWVSLIWVGIILALFGVGAVGPGGAVAGIIAVPLWATVFGFLGLGRARASILKEVGFQPCGADEPLAVAGRRLASSLGIRPPEIGTMDGFNAFAMGTDRNDATVTLGRPLLETLTVAEAEAVLGHELGHVVSGDMKRMMLMRTFQNATVWYMMVRGLKQIARWVICWGAELYILAYSRKREYWADAIGAALTSKEAMIGALKKFADAPPLTEVERTHARFMVRGRISGLFSTHPSLQQRIAALQDETYLRQLPRHAA